MKRTPGQLEDRFDLYARFLAIAAKLQRGGGMGKHRNGRRSGTNAQRELKSRRKRQRQARRYQRLCASGRKHTYRKRGV